MELALEKPEIALYLKRDKHSQEEVLKYFYLRAGGSFRELQELLENAAKANASDAQGIKARIDEWYRKKIQPIKDVLAETEEDEEEEEFMAGEVFPRTPGREETQEGAEAQVSGLRDEGGRGGPKRLPQRRR